jgi:hypothetical protein
VLVVDELQRDHGADAERGEEAEQDERAPPAEGIIIIKVVLDKLLYTWARFQREAGAAGVACAQPGAETYTPSTCAFSVGVDCDCGALCRLWISGRALRHGHEHALQLEQQSHANPVQHACSQHT